MVDGWERWVHALLDGCGEGGREEGGVVVEGDGLLGVDACWNEETREWLLALSQWRRMSSHPFCFV